MKLKRVVAWGLTLVMALSLDVPGVSASDDTASPPMTKEEQIAMATGSGGKAGQLPGTNRTFFDTETTDVRDWFNISGYVADGVQDRSEYYEEYVANGKKDTANYMVVEEDGYFEKTTGEYKTEDEYDKLSADAKANYQFITAEAQFMSALSRGARVVQVNAKELELGYLYLKRNGINGPISPVTDYDKGNAPQTNPILMEEFEGTGVSDLKLYSHLTLFSTTGCVIRHAGFDLGGCEDIIIRNFRLEGMYEWDDYYAAEKDEDWQSRKRYGWCNVSLNDSDNIWIDHCTFGYAFDGNVDLKNGSSVSITWCQFGVQDISTGGEGDLAPEKLPKWKESKGSELWKSILYMEELYQAWVAKGSNVKDERFYEYTKYREKGATPKELFRYAAMHSKVHLVGSGETSFYTNVDEKITLGFNYYTSVIQRMPMIRQGNGHMFNCIVDNTEYTANSKALNARGVGVGYTYANSVNNARDGASIGTDTCIFRDVDPSSGEERQGMQTGVDAKGKPVYGGLANININWQEIFAPTINHNLIVNSRIEKTEEASGEKVDYFGSSWDNNGENAFTKGWHWEDKSTLGDFKWSKWKNQDELAEFSSITNRLEGTEGKLTKYGSDYYNDFYEGSYELGYDYQCFELDKVEKMLAEYGGARKDIYGTEWSPLDYIQPYNKAVMEKTYKKKVTVNLNGATAEKENNTYYLKEGESLTLPTEEEMSLGEGYEFVGWRKGRYNSEGKLEYISEAAQNVTVSAGDTYEEDYYYAIWKMKTYEVTFNSMGGSAVEDVLTLQYNQMISQVGGFPESPTKEGYTFAGWYEYNLETQTYGLRVRANDVLNRDICLYAKWNKVATVTVTFETNGGNAIEPVEVETGKTVSSIVNPTKEGYTFTGWFKDQECTEPFDITTETITKAITLYAGWEIEGADVLPGDVNGNGKVNSEDALDVLKRDVKMAVPGFVEAAADVNYDGKIDSSDALEILKYDVHLITEFKPKD